MTTMDILRKNVRHLRRQMHETQLEAACEIGISEGHLRNIENGVTNPSVAVLDKMAAHYGTQTAQLLMMQPYDASMPVSYTHLPDRPLPAGYNFAYLLKPVFRLGRCFCK